MRNLFLQLVTLSLTNQMYYRTLGKLAILENLLKSLFHYHVNEQNVSFNNPKLKKVFR